LVPRAEFKPTPLEVASVASDYKVRGSAPWGGVRGMKRGATHKGHLPNKLPNAQLKG